MDILCVIDPRCISPAELKGMGRFYHLSKSKKKIADRLVGDTFEYGGSDGTIDFRRKRLLVK